MKKMGLSWSVLLLAMSEYSIMAASMVYIQVHMNRGGKHLGEQTYISYFMLL